MTDSNSTPCATCPYRLAAQKQPQSPQPLTPEQESLLEKTLQEAIQTHRRIGRRDFAKHCFKALSIPEQLTVAFVDRLCEHGKLAHYNQPVGLPCPKQMLCAVGDIPSKEERAHVKKTIQAEHAKKRKATWSAKAKQKPTKQKTKRDA